MLLKCKIRKDWAILTRRQAERETSQNWVSTLTSYNYSGAPVFKSQRHSAWLMVQPKVVTSLRACKKSAQSINLFLSWDEANFRVPGPKKLQPYLTMCILKVTFSFYTMYEHAKNQLNSFIYSWDTAHYGVL